MLKPDRTPQCDACLKQYDEVLNCLKRGDYALRSLNSSAIDGGPLGDTFRQLASQLEQQALETEKINQITANINAGLLLDDILERVYHDFRHVIPYNRIGFALIEDDGRTVRAHWAKSDQMILKLTKDYSAELAGSSLETIIATGRPRILNDLAAYLRGKPHSASTRLVFEEGMRSSLTCPLIANGAPVGFMFFSSTQPNTYIDVHVDTFKRIAGQLSVILEKGRLVTELSAQKVEIERQNAELQRLSELKNTFLGIAAHDLRGPIGNIQMIADLLSSETISVSPSERASLLGDIGKHTGHILALLDDLLDVTRIESGKLELRFENINLSQFLLDIIYRHKMMATVKGTRVQAGSIPEGDIRADPARLRQVLDNLISNAVKYSPPGSLVTVDAGKDGTGWRVNVRDQGPGITDQDRRRLFQDFAKLSARPTGGEKSTGLGLAITRRIVEAHGGKIDVDSVPGEGATFWFSLPDSF